jgi:hypothetical protein
MFHEDVQKKLEVKYHILYIRGVPQKQYFGSKERSPFISPAGFSAVSKAEFLEPPINKKKRSDRSLFFIF